MHIETITSIVERGARAAADGLSHLADVLREAVAFDATLDDDGRRTFAIVAAMADARAAYVTSLPGQE